MWSLPLHIFEMFIAHQQDIRKYVWIYISVAYTTIQFLRAQDSTLTLTSSVTWVIKRDVFPEMLTATSVASSSLSQEGAAVLTCTVYCSGAMHCRETLYSSIPLHTPTLAFQIWITITKGIHRDRQLLCITITLLENNHDPFSVSSTAAGWRTFPTWSVIN